MGPKGDRDTDPETAMRERWLEEARLALQAYHRLKDTDSRAEYAQAQAERATALRLLTDLIDRGVSIYFRVGAEPIRRYDTSKNAYQFTELNSRGDPLEPEEVLEFRYRHDFGLGPQEAITILGWLDFASVDDIAANLCNGGQLTLVDPSPTD